MPPEVIARIRVCVRVRVYSRRLVSEMDHAVNCNSRQGGHRRRNEAASSRAGPRRGEPVLALGDAVSCSRFLAGRL